MISLPSSRFELDAISYSSPEVGTYCDHLQVRYLTIIDMKELRVASVNLVKEKGSRSKHEYISVTVQDRERRIAYICFERNRGDECRRAQLTGDRQLGQYGKDPGWHTSLSSCPSFHLGQNASSCSSLFSVASLDSTKNTCRARDVVSLTRNTTRHSSDTVTRVLKCRRDMEPLYLHELAVLARTLHNTSIEYKLFSQNCYWYAGVLFELLEQRLKSKSTLGEHRNGVWGGLSIYKQEAAEDLARVMEQFNRNLAAFEHEIYEKEKRQRESERQIEELKQEVLRLKGEKSIQKRIQPSDSVFGHHKETTDVLHLRGIGQVVTRPSRRKGKHDGLTEEQVEEDLRRIEERQWEREE